jgi:putative holliday junction resolvase
MTAATAARDCLAFDFGTRRIGVAVGNTLLGRATPLRAIEVSSHDAAFATIGALIEQWQPGTLVVGVPRHSDGVEHAMTHEAERFARRLEGRFKLHVARVDERYSSVEAHARDTTTKTSLDARSAAVILEQYFHEAQAG